MPQIVERYDVYLPLRYNDGTRIGSEYHYQVERELFDRFGGVTSIKQENPLRGWWKEANQEYYDEIIIITVLDFVFSESQEGVHFFIDYKEVLKQRFQQRDVLITGQKIEVI